MMAASPFDAAIYRELLQDNEVAALFSDAAELRAMNRVEVALAKVQGGLGLIPLDSANAIERDVTEAKINPVSLAAATGRDGVPVPALIAALRATMDSPEHAQYLHWGATSQDIMDTGLMLRLREVCDLVDRRLKLLLQALADIADTHAELPMAARTRAQIATPTSFGAVITAWGTPLLTHLEALRLVLEKAESWRVPDHVSDGVRRAGISAFGFGGNNAHLIVEQYDPERPLAAIAELRADPARIDSNFEWHSEPAGSFLSVFVAKS